jgi:hypothetical protein
VFPPQLRFRAMSNVNLRFGRSYTRGARVTRQINIRRYLRSVVAALVTLMACLSFATQASCTLFWPVDLRACVHKAGVAFAGTVVGMRAERVPGTIVTRVTFSDVVFAKGGNDRSTLVLTMEGGVVGNKGVSADDLPEFALSRRYIVLADADLGSQGNHYQPIVYFNQGFFPLLSASAGGASFVHDRVGRPVVGFRDGHVVVLRSEKSDSAPEGKSPHSRPKHRGPSQETTVGGVVAAEVIGHDADTGQRLDEGQFIELIRQIARER